MADEQERAELEQATVPAINAATGVEAAIAVMPIAEKPQVVLSINEEEAGAHTWAVLPWELCALVDIATGRQTRLPRLSDMPGAGESSPFDLSVGAILREKPPEIDTNESIERMNQRRRAIACMERGVPAFDLVLHLDVPPGVLHAKTTVIGVPGPEVTASCMYWSAHLLRSTTERIPQAMAEHARRQRPNGLVGG